MKKEIVKASYGFIYKNPAAVSEKSNYIGTNVTLNSALFGDLAPKIADGMVIINALTDALNRNDGSKLAKATLKAACLNVQNLMRKWGPQVTIIANGNLATLEASGFDNYKQPQPVPNVFTPPAVVVKDTINSGVVKLQVPAIPFANKYQYRFATKENPTEADLVTLEPGKRVVKVEDLTPVKVYYFSCRVFGDNNSISDWNEFKPYTVR